MKRSRFFAFFLLLVFLVSALPGAAALDDPDVQATAALLVDADHDVVLYELNAHEKRYPASITKVMTALLTLEAVDRGELALDDMITATAEIHSDMSPDGSTQNIKTGETMSLLDLLYCVLLPSANEACNVLAIAVAGDIPTFVSMMNQRAAELGMTGTHFVNTHGLHQDDHYTTAWDIWLMAREAMKHDLFREIVATKEYYVPATNMSEQRHFFNTNALLSQLKYLGYVYEPAIGIKTGSTPEAGQCLVSAAERDGRTLYCVVLGAELAKQPDESYKRMNFSESSRLLEWGFDNFSYRTILESAEPMAEVKVALSDTDYVLARPKGSLSALIPNDLDVADFTQTVELDAEEVDAPVSEGQVLGKVTLSYGDEEYGSLDLVALNDVERSELLYRIDQVQNLIAQPWFKLAAAALVVLILALVVRSMVLGSRRKRRTRSYVGSSGRRRR